MTPLLLRALADAAVEKKRLVMDFRGLSYMNSSTLTPVIKILERARQSGGKISVQYRKSVKWQEISFSALIIFETQDQRIMIEGWG
jgi:anti-anti-sigma regulatory factor